MKNLVRFCSLKLAKFKRASRRPVPSIVSSGAKIKGDILNADVIQIDGQLEGNVACQELIIGTRGMVRGKVQAKTLSVYGSLNGLAQAEHIFVAASARFTGDLFHQSLAIEPGAFIEGNCVHQPKPEENKGVVTPIRAANDYAQHRS